MKNLAKLYKLTLKKLLIPELIIGIMSIVSSVLYLGGEIKTQSNYDYGVGNFFRGQPTAAVDCAGINYCDVFRVGGSDVYRVQLFK